MIKVWKIHCCVWLWNYKILDPSPILLQYNVWNIILTPPHFFKLGKLSYMGHIYAVTQHFHGLCIIRWWISMESAWFYLRYWNTFICINVSKTHMSIVPIVTLLINIHTTSLADSTSLTVLSSQICLVFFYTSSFIIEVLLEDDLI